MIVFLNGASSSGKTSLARALQGSWSGPLLYWSLDQVISQLPFSYTGNGVDAEQGFGINGPEIFAGDYGRALNELSAEYVGGLSAAGYDVVVDYVLLDEDLLRPFAETLADAKVCFVGLFCDEAALAERNAARNDRIPGLSLAQQSRVHFCRQRYDLELDSTTLSSEELATQLVSYIRRNSITKGMVPQV